MKAASQIKIVDPDLLKLQLLSDQALVDMIESREQNKLKDLMKDTTKDLKESSKDTLGVSSPPKISFASDASKSTMNESKLDENVSQLLSNVIN